MAVMRKEEYVALAAFRRSLRQYLRFVELGARRAGITPQQHQVLLTIRGQPLHEWASIRDLAESLQLKHNAAVGLVDRCAAAGLVVRSSNPGDQRLVRVSLTPKGAEILSILTERNLEELRHLDLFAEELKKLAGTTGDDANSAGSS
jgi:DNA-binding MarR family transcriptional regulator